MTTTRTYEVVGFTFRFESDDEVLVEVIDRCYRDLPTSDEAADTIRAMLMPDGSYEVTLLHPTGEIEMCEGIVWSFGVVGVVAWEVNHRAEMAVASWPVLHATVTAGPRGAVALCGQSRSGKSTIAAAAAQLGWQHLSDDLAPVDVSSMMVHPYARPIMLRSGGRSLLDGLPTMPAGHADFFGDEWFLAASELGATTATEPVPLVAVLFLGWREVAELLPISRAETLYELVLNSTTLGPGGAPVFRGLEKIAADVPGYRLQFSTVSEATELIRPLVGA